MRRHQFETYLDKVFDFSARVAALPDGRSYAAHSAQKVFQAVFLGCACQFASLHRIESECRQGALRHRIGPVSEDTIGYVLERQDPDAVFNLLCDIARQLKRNQVFASSWSRGLVVAAVDGIEIWNSYARCCDNCLERKMKCKLGEQECEQTQYYHRMSVVTIVSSAFPIPLGIRFQNKGEDELACSLALLQDLLRQLGRRFLDLLVADALYLRSPFVREIEALGLDWVINLKGNQPDLLAEAERRATSQLPQTPCSQQDQSFELWYLPKVDWLAADRDVNVVKTVGKQCHNRQQVEHSDSGEKVITKVAVEESSTNFYASNIELGSIPPFFIHQLGRSRWNIDAQLFQGLTREGGLKQASLHQGFVKAPKVLTTIRVIAYSLSQVFYHRQVRSHFRRLSFGFCDLARHIANNFLLVSAPDSS